MGKKKKLRDELERMMLDQMKRNNAPNPELEMLKGFHKNVINWHLNPSNTVKDIQNHPTIGGKLPTYQLAKTFRDKGRIGRGIAGLGGKNDSAYTKDLELQQDFERGITSAGMLEEGLQTELDSSAANLANLEAQDQQRRSSSNSMIQYMHGDLNRRISAGSWGGFFKSLLGSAIPIATAAFTGGGSLAATGSAAGSAGASIGSQAGSILSGRF
jgi:hypothetical protein